MEFTPDLRIVLKDYATENVTDETRVVWHPGDSLEGYLQVSSTVTAAVARINVFFEGSISRHHGSVEKSHLLLE